MQFWIKFKKWILAFFLAFLFSHQNCAPTKFGSSPDNLSNVHTSPTGASTAENGSWYQGIVFNEHYVELCAGQNTNVRTSISYVVSTGEFWLLRKDCQDIEPIVLETGSANFIDTFQVELNYGGILLVRENLSLQVKEGAYQLSNGVALQSCNQYLQSTAYRGESSGKYWLSGAGNNQFQVFCDMQTEGGGWTLIYASSYTESYDIVLSPLQEPHFKSPTMIDPNSATVDCAEPNQRCNITRYFPAPFGHLLQKWPDCPKAYARISYEQFAHDEEARINREDLLLFNFSSVDPVKMGFKCWRNCTKDSPVLPASGPPLPEGRWMGKNIWVGADSSAVASTLATSANFVVNKEGLESMARSTVLDNYFCPSGFDNMYIR